MEIKAVKGFGKLGVAVTNIAFPFVDSEIQELRNLMRENLVLVMEKVNFTKEQFYEVSGLLGTISTHGQKKDKPTQHTTGYLDENSCPMFPGMDKVTAKKTDGKYNSVAPGLSKRLNWHCAEAERDKINGIERPLPEFVGLQGVEYTEGSITQVCQMIDRFELESIEKQNELRNIKMQWAYVEGDDAIVPDIPDELKTAETGHEGDFMDKKQPLVKTAINGKDGLHFSPSQITGIVGKDEEEFVKLKKYIMQEYVTPEYIYDHVWQDGDILWMDQHVTIHRRIGTDGSESMPIEQLEKRLLHRIEVHDDYTLKKVTNTL